MSVCFKDVVKGIELNLETNVGHIKNECLAHEQENATLLHDINIQKMDTLSAALQVEQINKTIRELEASIKRAEIRIKHANDEMKKAFEEAMGKEEDAHTSKSRSEAFHQNLFALHDQIYEAQNHRKQMELDQSSMFTGSEFKCVQGELRDTPKKLKRQNLNTRMPWHSLIPKQENDPI